MIPMTTTLPAVDSVSRHFSLYAVLIGYNCRAPSNKTRRLTNDKLPQTANEIDEAAEQVNEETEDGFEEVEDGADEGGDDLVQRREERGEEFVDGLGQVAQSGKEVRHLCFFLLMSLRVCYLTRFRSGRLFVELLDVVGKENFLRKNAAIRCYLIMPHVQ